MKDGYFVSVRVFRAVDVTSRGRLLIHETLVIHSVDLALRGIGDVLLPSVSCWRKHRGFRGIEKHCKLPLPPKRRFIVHVALIVCVVLRARCILAACVPTLQ